MSQDLNIVLIGVTRSGKTSFANTFSGQANWGQVGTDDGESTTFDVNVCEATVNGTRVNIFDTPGLNDSLLRMPNKIIKHNIELSLLNSLNTTIDAFLLVESLQGESITMRQNATALVEIFGQEAMKSCIALLTKTSLNTAKLASCQNTSSSLGCPFVLWKNNHIDEDSGNWVNLDSSELKAQTESLFAVLSSLPKFHMSNLQMKKDEIMRRASTLREQTPVQYQTVTTVIDVPYKEPEVIKVTKQRPVKKDRWKKGRFGKITGLKEHYIEWVNYQEDETIYHDRVRQETRVNSVPLPKPPIEDFVPIAKKEVIDSFKATL